MAKKVLFILLIIVLVVVGCAVIYLLAQKQGVSIWTFIRHPLVSTTEQKLTDFTTFKSAQEFKDYLAQGESADLARTFGLDVRSSEPAMTTELGLETTKATGLGEAGQALAPDRVSVTNVQVSGIDEPDIVKTDGQEIYFSPNRSTVYPIPIRAIESVTVEEPVALPEGETAEEPIVLPESGVALVPPVQPTLNTKVVKALPLTDLKIEATIDKTGQLLLTDNILVVFTTEIIYGYDVSQPQTPKELWQLKLDEQNQLVSARLYGQTIYLITQTTVDQSEPCPIKPIIIKDTPLTITCDKIYYPTVNLPVDVTYTVLAINPQTGQAEKTVAFVGSSANSVIYMSPEAIYITYSYPGKLVEFLYNFLQTNSDLVKPSLLETLKKLIGYDISEAAKLVEFEVNYTRFINSLGADEKLKLENELQNRVTDYSQKHLRELEKTGLVKINVEDLVVQASGEVPGDPLNQFSLDEYDNHLRIATTSGQRWWGVPLIGGTSKSVNDVYVLDQNLKIVGSVTDLGLAERIYSVRFIQDKGYVVTFKQIDPFYVLDLANPQNPKLAGELKIPGYSSYLHPITKDKILGIGEENNKVKVSLFDVSSPTAPKELAKYQLDEYWSEIASTHHAFLLDSEHQVFFLPGSKGGYIFSYKDNQLQLVKAVSDISARRAVYINNYLYILGDDQIVVLDEANWETVKTLAFSS